MTVTRIVMAGLLAAALSVISILAALPAHAADAVFVKAEELQGFARLRFQWPDAVTVEAQESNGVVVLKFARPFQASLNDLPIELPNYVALARQDADGSTLRLALKFPFRVEALTAANEVYVNLIPENSQAGFPGLPPEVLQREQAARAAAEKAEAARRALALVALPDVPVRVGVHNSYSRIVFDWDDEIDYKVSRDGSRLDLEFSAPGHLKIGRLRVDPPPFVTDAEAETDADNARLRLTISPDAEFRMFREPSGIVLDLTAASEDAGALAALELNQRAFEGVLPNDAADATSRNQATPVPVETSSSAPNNNQPINQNETPGAVTMIDPRRIGRPDASRIVKDSGYAQDLQEGQSNGQAPGVAAAGSEQAPSDVTLDAAGLRPDTSAPATPSDSLSVDTPRIVKPTGDAQTKTVQAGDDATSEAEAGAQAALNDTALEEVAASSGPTASQDPAGSVRVRRRGDLVTFSFTGLAEAPAAIFERAGHVWALFETDIDIEKPVLTEEHVRFVDAAEVFEGDNLRGVRLRLSSDALVTGEYDDGVWSVAIGEAVLRPPTALTIRRGVNPDGGGKLFAIAPDAAFTRRITDPQVGDTLAVVPMPGPVRGVLSPRQTVDLEVLASAHGLIFRPIADDVVIALNGAGEVSASRRAGLVLTANPRRPAAAEVGRQNNVFAPGVVGFRLASGDPDDFHSGLSKLNATVARASTPNERKDARLALVRFYLGYEYGSEALGVLRLMADAREDQDSDPEFMMLRGIAKHMIGRNNEAVEDLSVPALRYDPNAAVWRTLVNSQLSRYADARPDLARARTVLSDYAPTLQARFHLAAANVSLGVNDIASVESDLRKVPDNGLDHKLFSERTLLAGRLAEANGNTEEALSLYAQAIAMDHRPVAARATLVQAGLLRTLDAEGAPSASAEGEEGAELAAVDRLQEAIDTLDRLRFTWRGGEVELDAVAELAKIYEQQGDYRSALTVMRTVATQFPDADKGRDIADQMVAMFRRLFLDGEVDSLKPLDALSLFYDFRELTPVGRDGDEMIRELADRLVAVDLLDQAAEMLDHQVTHRLRGVARAQVAGRLAAVHLLNSAPDKALAALRKTRQAQLPRQIADERLLFEAKALSALDRHDHALELLADNRSAPARALTADVLWEAGKYSEAGRALEDILGLAWTRDEPLSEDEQFDVLRAAIAYVLAREGDSVERIRQKYAEKMAEGPQAASFSIVASSSDGRGIAFRDLAREIAQVDTLDRFMSGYRSRYEAGQVGEEAIN